VANIDYEMKAIDTKPFADLIGEDIIAFVFEHTPKKVATRIARALVHYARAPLLIGVDEEMGAIRLVAAEEELVVAIFEWLKLNEDQFPEHRDFGGAGGGPSRSGRRLRDRAVRRCPGRGAVVGGGVEPGRRARRQRHRARRHCIRAAVEWRPDRDGRRIGDHSSQTDRHTGGPAQTTRGLPRPHGIA
jgi:hypothetical protein